MGGQVLESLWLCCKPGWPAHHGGPALKMSLSSSFMMFNQHERRTMEICPATQPYSPSHLRLVTLMRAAVASFFSASSCAATSFWYLAGTLLSPVFMFTVTTSPSVQVTTIDSAAAAPLLPPGHAVHQIRGTAIQDELKQNMPKEPGVSEHGIAQLVSAAIQQTAGP